MAKSEWGMKRSCLSCGAKFYDLQKDPIICPKCDTTFDPEAATKLKRGRSVVAEKEAKPAAAEADADETLLDADDLDDNLDESAGEDVLENTDDLGGDDVPVVGAGGTNTNDSGDDM